MKTHCHWRFLPVICVLAFAGGATAARGQDPNGGAPSKNSPVIKVVPKTKMGLNASSGDAGQPGLTRAGRKQPSQAPPQSNHGKPTGKPLPLYPPRQPLPSDPPASSSDQERRQTTPKEMGNGESQRDSAADSPAVTERLMTQKLGPERVKRYLDDFAAKLPGDRGKSSSNANRWADQAEGGTGVDDVLNPGGTTAVFQRAQVSGREYTPSVAQTKHDVAKYGSPGGGINLEGVAGGLGRIASLSYDPRFNAFILNNRAAYFIRVPRKSVAILCQAIGRD